VVEQKKKNERTFHTQNKPQDVIVMKLSTAYTSKQKRRAT